LYSETLLLKMKHMVSLTARQPFTHDKYVCTQDEGLEIWTTLLGMKLAIKVGCFESCWSVYSFHGSTQNKPRVCAMINPCIVY